MPTQCKQKVKYSSEATDSTYYDVDYPGTNKFRMSIPDFHMAAADEGSKKYQGILCLRFRAGTGLKGDVSWLALRSCMTKSEDQTKPKDPDAKTPGRPRKNPI